MCRERGGGNRREKENGREGGEERERAHGSSMETDGQTV